MKKFHMFRAFLIISILCSQIISVAHATFIDSLGTLQDSFTIDADDSAASTDHLVIQFGTTLNKQIYYDKSASRFTLNDTARIEGNLGVVGSEYVAGDHTASSSAGVLNLGKNGGGWESLQWNITDSRFVLSNTLLVNGSLTANGFTSTGDVNFSGNQASNMRLENLASSPTCDSSFKGRTYFNTTNSGTYVCDGTAFVRTSAVANKNYAYVFDTTTQTVVAANTYQDIIFNSNSLLDGWTHTAGTAEFTCAQTGVYMVIVNMSGTQPASTIATAESGTPILTVRGLFNGAQIGASDTSIVLSDVPDAPTPSVHTFLMTGIAGQIFKLQMQGTITSVSLSPATTAAGSSSVSVTVLRMG